MLNNKVATLSVFQNYWDTVFRNSVPEAGGLYVTMNPRGQTVPQEQFVADVMEI
jgi:hypothetical protein